MRKIVLILMLFITVLSIFGCSKQISDTAYNDLITNLEKKDFNVIAEDVEENILQGQRKWLTINENENISAYLYESSERWKKMPRIDKEGRVIQTVTLRLKLVGSHTHTF